MDPFPKRGTPQQDKVMELVAARVKEKKIAWAQAFTVTTSTMNAWDIVQVPPTTGENLGGGTVSRFE